MGLSIKDIVVLIGVPFLIGLGFLCWYLVERGHRFEKKQLEMQQFITKSADHFIRLRDMMVTNESVCFSINNAHYDMKTFLAKDRDYLQQKHFLDALTPIQKTAQSLIQIATEIEDHKNMDVKIYKNPEGMVGIQVQNREKKKASPPIFEYRFRLKDID